MAGISALGILRVLLSISVVISHSAPVLGITLVGGMAAVESFYILSGFYMSLILNEKYVDAKGGNRLFISNRLIRIYPAYLAVLILTAILAITLFFLCRGPLLSSGGWLSLGVRSYIDMSAHLDISNPLSVMGPIFIAIVNITIIGQDIAWYLNGSGILGTESNGILVPQAWALSQELMFYLIAPFILRRKMTSLVGILGLSLLIRIAISWIGLADDPYIYRFFPAQLAFFMLGAISYRAYVILRPNGENRLLSISFAIAVTGFSLLFQFIPIQDFIKLGIYYFLISISLPALFTRSRHTGDIFLGNLSYSIYITHILVISLLRIAAVPENLLGMASISLTLVLSFLLLKSVIEPLDRIREVRAKPL
jgi:peptidoglycan/LPS O-acetylase OafA/YrhL